MSNPPTGFKCDGSVGQTSATGTPQTLYLVNASGVASDTVSSYVWQNNGNPVLAATQAAQYAAVGFQVINIRTGEPVSVLAALYSGATPQSCNLTSPTFAQPAQKVGANIFPTGVGPLASAGSSPWLGYPSNPVLGYTTWTQSMAQVTYPSTITGSDLTGLCILNNGSGGSHDSTVNHVGIITNNYYPIAPQATGFIHNHALLNSYLLTQPGCAAGSCGWTELNIGAPIEGTKTEVVAYDATSMSNYGDAFIGRLATYYTEFPDNPYFPETSFATPCTNSAGCNSPSPNMYFPTACGMGFTGTGTWAHSSCSGNIGTTAPDYHVYKLASGSTYQGAAPDGSGDIGPNIPAIDAALVLNQFTDPVCGTSCPGPFPDLLGVVQAPTLAPAEVIFSLNFWPVPDYSLGGNSQ